MAKDTNRGPAAASRPEHALGMTQATQLDLTRRLARIKGQVAGLQRMIDDERYCPEILQQFAAVHSALRSAERELLTSHLNRCATQAIERGGEAAEAAREELVDLLFRYTK